MNVSNGGAIDMVNVYKREYNEKFRHFDELRREYKRNPTKELHEQLVTMNSEIKGLQKRVRMERNNLRGERANKRKE